MARSLATIQLNILHAEDKEAVFESCKGSILQTFDKQNLPEPMIEKRV